MWWLLACTTAVPPGAKVEDSAPPVEEEVEAEVEEAHGLIALPPGLLLRRLSLDLRGTAPTTEELARVEADVA